MDMFTALLLILSMQMIWMLTLICMIHPKEVARQYLDIRISSWLISEIIIILLIILSTEVTQSGYGKMRLILWAIFSQLLHFSCLWWNLTRNMPSWRRKNILGRNVYFYPYLPLYLFLHKSIFQFSFFQFFLLIRFSLLFFLSYFYLLWIKSTPCSHLRGLYYNSMLQFISSLQQNNIYLKQDF